MCSTECPANLSCLSSSNNPDADTETSEIRNAKYIHFCIIISILKTWTWLHYVHISNHLTFAPVLPLKQLLLIPWSLKPKKP